MNIIKNPIVLGVDIGGSHITAALVDLETRVILTDSYRRKAVDSHSDAEEILSSWCELLNDSYRSMDVITRIMGIAMPGPFDYENGISYMQDQDKFSALYGVNVKEQLAERLDIPEKQIRFINDAESFLQGEVFSGAGRNHNRVLGLTLGTGLGSAIHLDGNTEDADLWNSSFKDGIAEDYLSGRWFVHRYKELTGKSVEGVKELTELSDSKEIIKMIFLEFYENLSDFIIPLIQKYKMECVVIGGNITNAFSLFLLDFQQIFSLERTHAEVKIAYLKEDASLIGAASCWEDSYSLNEYRHD